MKNTMEQYLYLGYCASKNPSLLKNHKECHVPEKLEYFIGENEKMIPAFRDLKDTEMVETLTKEINLAQKYLKMYSSYGRGICGRKRKRTADRRARRKRTRKSRRINRRK